MMKSTAETVPLCVDLDGTLILTDGFFETLVRLLRIKPWYILFIPVWLLSGRAGIKQKVAQLFSLDVTSLPYRHQLVAFLEAEYEKGRTLVLATAANQAFANEVAAHLGVFSMVVASDGTCNLKGKKKADRLLQLYGHRGFDYVGNSRDDIPVWRQARQALAVGVNPRVLPKIRQLIQVELMFGDTGVGQTNVLRLFRIHHWVKNILVFSPLLLSHQVQDFTAWWHSAVTFLAFSLTASAVYISNDLLDLQHDRILASKKNRSFVRGDVSLGLGVVMVPALLLTAFAIGFSVTAWVSYLLIVYVCLNLAYSLWLKSILFLDVLLLAGFYVLRIFIGSVATGIAISPWFMAFSLFLFLSLALVKRVSELIEMEQENLLLSGRGYQPRDQKLLLNFGAISGYLSVLVLALYINDSNIRSLYQYPNILWGMCPVLLFWLSRLWLLTGRGEVHSDPIVFAFKDQASRLTALLAISIWFSAWGLLPL